MPSIVIPSGHVGLVLVRNGRNSFYLQIPSNSITSLCRKPVKYLLFLGWCILGVEGELSFRNGNQVHDLDGDLVDKELYSYKIDESGPYKVQAVDLEVIKMRTTAPSETTGTREDFCRKLLERDVGCVWTGIAENYGSGLHIIPHRRGSDWLQLIIENRPHYDESVEDLNEINDIRNGMFASATIHAAFDSRDVIILKTPNRYLQPGDIPPRYDYQLANNAIYPRHDRYTLQWINPVQNVVNLYGNNRDAAFKKHTKKPKPSDLLLHYNYGAAAVKQWGCGINVYERSLKPPRPPEPIPASSRPSRTTHSNRKTAIRKRKEAQKRHGITKRSKASTSKRGAVEMEEGLDEATWDEDDVMLFFWGNSRAATERHSNRIEEKTHRMEQWRKGLPPPCA